MTDILIIGGGIAGLSAGARLSEGATVTLLEAEDALGYHTSGRSAALYEANYGSPSTVALNHASRAYHSEANGGYLSPRGLLILAEAHDREAFEADVKTMGVDPLSPAQALEMVPILDPNKVALAGYHEGAYDIDTDRLMQDFARTIRAGGGRVITGARVTDIRFDGRSWQVTAGETYHTATLVNAAGAWADPVARMAGIAPLGIVPHRRSIARIAAPEGHDTRAWPVFFGVGETWYAKPDAGALLVSPADEDPCEPHDAYADDMTLAEGLYRYENMVKIPVTRPIATWAGLRSFAPDRNLVLGRDPSNPAFVWCAGQGGYGFQSAPGASQLLADLVNGRPPEIETDMVACLTPDRLRR